MKESDAVRAICEYLARRKHFFWRQNTMPPVQKFGDGTMAFRRMPAFSMKGVPDIILIDRTGHFVGLEVKMPKKKLSPDQELFKQRCKDSGAEYHLVRSIDDVQELGF